ncbi:MAG: isoleucine--tRNA ligase [Spirochaetales bacterium]|nr:isoleucine--tRNA ligase [Spirochaetales bacterium]
MYKPVDPKVNFPKMEEDVLKFWEENAIFAKSVENRADAPEYVFYDGPPFATGLPHFGHFVPGTIKDIIPRFRTMKGMKVERRFGWDCHGLPVEYEMEKELGISGKTEIEKFGVAEFNEACRSIVLRYTGEWRKIMTRSGRWVDFDHDYKTMDSNYMESIWWVVKSLWDKGLVYKGHYILPTCPRCSTPLSNHELNLGGYKDVHDPAVTVRFAKVGEDNTYFLAWTTTPWTLVSNLGLSVGSDIDYVTVEDSSDGTRYILAEARLGDYFRSEEEYTLISKAKGSDFAGQSYQPLFPYFGELAQQGAFKVFAGDHVSTEDGTGIVHTAPGFGEDDYTVMKGSGVPVVCPVDDEGRYTKEVSDYQGRFVKDCDKDIINRLKESGDLVKRDQILHSYPHCWRCDSPLIYKAVGSWFVDIQKIKNTMLEANNSIHWVPDHLKKGRFGKWLENARDWAISRNRYWGNPIPVWECDSCEKSECLGSRDELYSKIGSEAAEAHRAAGGDLHKHHVDGLEWSCSCGGTMKRVPEVLDCWFESGSMPYAQVHYPFENKEWFEAHFPADFIAEGLDQTRGWFYTLTILGAALFGTPAFRHVVVNGLVLAEDGKKMSKSLRNYTDPGVVIDQFGADALRLFLMNSAVVKAESLRYSDDGVRDVLKGVLLPLWNAYSFYVTYANIDGYSPETAPENPANPLDKWVLSETGKLVENVEALLEAYDIQKAIEPILGFIDALNNWYIRRSRRRFWKSAQDGSGDQDKREAYATLRVALLTLAKVAAPFVPFISEEIYRNLRNDSDPESVHLCDWPQASSFPRDEELELKMEVTRRTVSLGRSLRNAHELKIRQPLKCLHIVTRDKNEKAVLFEMAELLAEELNVKDVQFRENEEELVEYSAKANFKVLGRQLGKDMKAAASRIALLTPAEIQSLMDGAVLSIEFDGQQSSVLELTADAVEVRRSEKAGLKVLNEGSLTVALDPQITPELLAEGLVRDLVRGIQNLRKEGGFDVTDRIALTLESTPEVQDAVQSFEDYLKGEVLADSLEWNSVSDGDSVAVGDFTVMLKVEKSAS